MMSIDSIDLNLLRILHFVLEEGSVSKAAARLNVTASAVSNALARLRSLLDDPLFVRNGRSVTPTPRALELRPQIAAAIEALRSALQSSNRFQPETCRRCFTIASADNICVGLLPSIISRLANAMPKATLQMVTLDHGIASGGLLSGEVDVLLGLPPEMTPNLRSGPAYTESLVCALNRDVRVPKRGLSLRQFLQSRHIRVVLQGRYPIDYIDGCLAELGHERDVAISVPHFFTAALCAAETSNIAMLPRTMVEHLRQFLPLALYAAPFKVPPIEIKQVWHIRSETDPASALFRQIVRGAGETAAGTPPVRGNRAIRHT